MTDLLPCPFCGDPNPRLTHDDYVHDDLRPMSVVECTKCHTWVRAEAWNTRAKAKAAVPDWMASSSQFAERVYHAGWRDLADAQHEGIAVMYGELAAATAQTGSAKGVD